MTLEQLAGDYRAAGDRLRARLRVLRRAERLSREEQERFEAEQKDLRKIIDQIREKSEQASSGGAAPAAEPGSGTATP